jgi:hypothetical protein
MSHFAQIDENDIVTQVIVAEQDFINSGAVGDPSRWIQTSYNTFAGEHKNGGEPLRKNYAGIGYSYVRILDAFVPPKPAFDSWKLNTDTCQWEAPVSYPTDGKVYEWNELGRVWQEIITS